jgi:hypothetical protein
MFSWHFQNFGLPKPEWKPISLGLNSGTSIMRDYYLKEE